MSATVTAPKPSLLASIAAFFESPPNRAGLSAWGATVATAAIQYFIMHQAPSTADLLGFVIGLGLIVAPDNTVTVAQLEKAIADVALAVTTKSPAAIESVITDGAGLVQSVTQEPVK